MSGEPEVRVEAGDVRPLRPGHWQVGWRIASREPLVLEACRLPHDHFFGPERVFSPERSLDRAHATVLDLEVACADPAGAEIENAFLILRVRRATERWLVLARLRVRVSERGTPAPLVQRVSAQRYTT